MFDKILEEFLLEKTSWLEEDLEYSPYRVPPPSWRIPISELSGNSWSRRERTEALGCRSDQSLIELLPLAPSPLTAGSRPAAPKAPKPTQEAGASWVVALEQTVWKTAGALGLDENVQVQSSETESIVQTAGAAKTISFCVSAPWCRSRVVVSAAARVGMCQPCWEMVKGSTQCDQWAGRRGVQGKEQCRRGSTGMPYIAGSGRDGEEKLILWKKPAHWYPFTPHSTLSLQINGWHNLTFYCLRQVL